MKTRDESKHRGHELRDANARGVLWFLAGFIVFAALLHLVIGWLHLYLSNRHPERFWAERPEVLSHEEWPKPALQLAPQQNLEHLRAEEERLLHEYAWVDRERGIVRIPIERAMQLSLASQNAGKVGK